MKRWTLFGHEVQMTMFIRQKLEWDHDFANTFYSLIGLQCGLKGGVKTYCTIYDVGSSHEHHLLDLYCDPISWRVQNGKILSSRRFAFKKHNFLMNTDHVWVEIVQDSPTKYQIWRVDTRTRRVQLYDKFFRMELEMREVIFRWSVRDQKRSMKCMCTQVMSHKWSDSELHAISQINLCWQQEIMNIRVSRFSFLRFSFFESRWSDWCSYLYSTRYTVR